MGASPFTVGVLMALYALLPMLLAVAAGRLSDRVGTRRPMLIGSALIALGAWSLGQQESDAANLIYLTAVSVAASDTIASELGVLSNRTFLITSMNRVAVGTDGGVSVYGTAWALVGAAFASILGWMLLFPWGMVDARLLIPIAMGFLGCNMDSLIGATLERRGIVSKLGTNILSMSFGALGSLLIISLL
jgi:uncharacterized protein (TIGR00297 family)